LLSPLLTAGIFVRLFSSCDAKRAYIVSNPLPGLFVVLSIVALAGLFLSLAIVGLHIREDLRIDLEKMRRVLRCVADVGCIGFQELACTNAQTVIAAKFKASALSFAG
jgi:hypothetical protein